MNEYNIPEKYKYQENNFMMDMFYDYGIKTPVNKLLNLYGGKPIEEKIVSFIDEGGVYHYKFTIKEKHQQVYLSVLSKDNDECVTVIIDIENKVAVLHNMSYYENGAYEGLKKPGGGSKLLRFTLNLILNYKDKYNINKILLKDNSFLYCNSCSETIKLAQLRMITHGQTWYMKYGFMPYDSNLQKPSKDLLRNIKLNNKLLDKMKVSDINIIDLCHKAIKKENLNLNMNNIKIIIDKYPYVIAFVKRLLNEYDKYCCIVLYIMKRLYGPGGLYDFHGKVFYLDV